MWSVNLSQLLYTLRLALFCLLLATVLRIGLAVVMLYARSWIDTKRDWAAKKLKTSASLPLYTAWRILGALSELPSTSRILTKAVIFFAGVSLGYMTSEVQRYNRLAEPRLQIREKIDHHRYWVREVDKKTNQPIDQPAGQWHIWQPCEEPSTPDFDPGMTVDVWYEDLGCPSFLDQRRTGWVVSRDASGKFIDFREEQ